MIERDITAELQRSAAEYPAVTILGPRQSGKTTLARKTFPDKPWVSLEDPDVRMAAEADPRGFLGQFPDGVILDEVQRLPELLSYLQGVIDREGGKGRFILTGSHQPRLHEVVSQSLAGRTAVLTLWPFSLAELRRYAPLTDPFELIVRGCYPRVHEEKLDSRRFYNSYLQTYVERDVRALIQLRDLSAFQKFLVLLAGRIGQVVNLASLANDVGVSAPALRQWLSVLKASYLVFELPPWFENIGKRLIKSPKLYFADAGLAAFLLGIHTAEQASRDPLRGNLYENLIVADVQKQLCNAGTRPELYFYRDTHGNEVDLLVRHGRALLPVEIKSSRTFSLDFLKGISRFKAAAGHGVADGFVLFNGENAHAVHGVQVVNPLQNDAWLTAAIQASTPTAK
ncbi:MAG: ATP-binding protein [Rhodocyclaceae bacterium]|nr:ATP-binding protein [Rhodocyclaceae bacterium]